MAIAGYLIRVRTSEKAIPEYISSYLNSEHGKKTLQHMGKNIVGMANINAKELQKIKIMIPPINYQIKYKNILQKKYYIKQAMIIQFEKLEKQFWALTQKAFEGKL
jgi:type I restriction enzyme S subunit